MKPFIAKTTIGLCIVILSLLTFARVSNHGYVLYDDTIIVNAPNITAGFSLKNISIAILQPPAHIPYQMPLPLVCYMAMWHFFGDNLGIHHLVAVFLHTLSAVFLFLFFARSTQRVWESAVVVILFTIHPLNVEPVCWYAGLNGLMAWFFLITALLAYHFYTLHPSIKRYALVLLFFCLGLLSKPTIILLPLLLLVLDIWPLERISLPSFRSFCTTKASAQQPSHRHNRQDIKWLIMEKIPLVLSGIGLLLLPAILSGKMMTVDGTGFRIVQPGAILYYLERLWKILDPLDLTIFNPSPAAIPLHSLIAAGVVFTGITISGALLNKRRHGQYIPGYIVAGWLWYLICLAPAIFSFTFSDRTIGDRHTYMALVGIFVIIIWLFSAITRHVKFASIIRRLTALLAIGTLTLISIQQVPHWQNSITLYTREIKLHPQDPRPQANMGDAVMEKGEIEKALHYYKKALKMAPDMAITNTKTGMALHRLGEIDEALFYYRRALSLQPDYAVAHNNIGDLFLEQREIDKAIFHFRKALTTLPFSFKLHNNLAIALIQKGRMTEAIFHLKKALAINPEYETARKNLEKIADHMHQEKE
ncbi:MAG: tetratricopeptide repeat protein [Thermodesulfobacteriota bacterium]|nr:tetratricopeptide repeat protein [Thermodesulfobacteriota bacterium]